MASAEPPASRSSSDRGLDRGVSEVISYAMVFSLILVSVSIVTVGGVGTLEDVRSAEQAKNAQRAYDVLANNMEDVYVQGAPSRATEIDLGDSHLFLGEPTIVNVTLEYSGGQETSVATEIRPIIYRLGDRQSLVYENGAVFQTRPDSGTIVTEPPQTFHSERAVVPIIRTRSVGVSSVGSTTVLIRAESRASTLFEPGSSQVTNLNINVTSPRADLWQRYYEEEVSMTAGDCDRPSDDRVRCDINPSERVHVALQEIDVSLIP